MTTYDKLGRIESQSWEKEAPSVTRYHYPDMPDNPTHEGNLPEQVENAAGTFTYLYDKNGNIIQIGFTAAGSTAEVVGRYQYDELNQLIREDSGSQEKTFVYEYDLGRNLVSVREYGYTTGTITGEPVKTSTGKYAGPPEGGTDAAEGETGTSGTTQEYWRDQLLEWKEGQEAAVAMTYDDIGNMLTKGSRSFSWLPGRKLASVTDGDTVSTYQYDHTGNRVKKTVAVAGEEGGTGTTTVTTYCMAGDLLVSETRTTGNGSNAQSSTLWYQYDSSGMAVAVRYSGNRYVYLRNLQNDVIGLLDSEGNLVVRYEYDSWGRVLKVEGSLKDTIGALNPFRYRGYYYDAETGLYYLKSRYYDPEMRRFISPDNLIVVDGQLNSINLYVYCKNNPVNYTDPTGHFWEKIVGFIGEVGNVMQQLAPVYTVCNDVAAAVWGILLVELLQELPH